MSVSDILWQGVAYCSVSRCTVFEIDCAHAVFWNMSWWDRTECKAMCILFCQCLSEVITLQFLTDYIHAYTHTWLWLTVDWEKCWYFLIYLLHGARVLLEKLTGFHLVKKFPAFFGTRRFITIFKSAPLLPLFWARLIQSLPPHPTLWRSILILSSRLTPGYSKWSHSLRFHH
jgi:hypothetical protein